jgi:hypothetical protein
MISIGSIINTHTGPARVTVMLPAYMKDGIHYSQALTQAVGGLVATDSVASSALSAAAGQAGSGDAGSDQAAPAESSVTVVASGAQASSSDDGSANPTEPTTPWKPTGLAKMAELYKANGTLAALHGAKPHLNLLG